MMLLVQGGSGSGKSNYAEERTVLLSKSPRYYLATMKIYDDEGRQKIERHKKLRAGKGFLTIEQSEKVEAVINQLDKDGVVLLECLSNLIANEMFSEPVCNGCNQVAADVLKGISVLAEKVKHLIVVTNNVFEDGIQYEAETREYMEALGQVNQRLAALADEVIEVVVGIPVTLKRSRQQNEKDETYT